FGDGACPARLVVARDDRLDDRIVAVDPLARPGGGGVLHQLILTSVPWTLRIAALFTLRMPLASTVCIPLLLLLSVAPASLSSVAPALFLRPTFASLVTFIPLLVRLF